MATVGRKWVWGSILALTASQAACSKSHPTSDNEPPKAVEKPTSPPAASMPNAIAFDATGGADFDFGKCQSGHPTGLHFEVRCEIREAYDYPFTLDVPGSEPIAAKPTDPPPSPRVQSREVSLLPAFGRAPINPYKATGDDAPELTLDPATQVTMVFQNGTRLSGKLPVVKVSGIVDYLDITKDLGARAKTGFQFSKDEPPVTQHAILHLSKHDVDVIGPAAHYNETDWTAVEEGVERDTPKICKGYKVDDDSAPRDLPLFAEDITVTVRNRVTGEVLQTKTFASDMVCPFMAAGHLVAGPPSDAIAKWLSSLVAKKK